MEAEGDGARGLMAPLREALARLTVGGLRDRPGAQALTQVEEQLARQAATIPRAGVLANAIRRCLTLEPSEAAPRLLKLLVAVEQLGSDEIRADEVADGPVLHDAVSTLATPLDPLALLQLRAALDRRSTPPHAVLALLSDPATGADPRAWPLLEAGLAHPFLRERCAARIAELGRAFEARLLSSFDRRGTQTDAARLQALAGIMRRRALPLLRTCVAQGSPQVRRQALTSLLALSPDEATELLCAQFDRAPVDDEALYALLAASGRAPALRRLLSVLAQEGVLTPHAFLRLPDEAMALWLSLAQAEGCAVATSAPFFELLEHHPAPAARAYLRTHCDARRQPDPVIRRRAAEALLAAADPSTLDFLIACAQTDPALETIGVTAGFARGPQVAFETLAPRLRSLPPAQPQGSSPRDGEAPFELPLWLTVTLQSLTPAADRRWSEALAPLAASRHPLLLRALSTLAGPPDASKTLEVRATGADAASPTPMPPPEPLRATANRARKVR